jgi:transposase
VSARVFVGMEHGRSDFPSSLADCQRMIRELQQLVNQQQATIETYHTQLERAAEQITLLKKALFSPRRERFAPDSHQQSLFTPQPLAGATDEPNTEDASNESADEEPPPAHDRSLKRRKKRIVFPQFLPRQRIEYPLPKEERPCGNCSQERVVIRERVTERLEIEPTKAYVVQHVRYTYACPSCRDGRQVVTTQKPPQAVEKSPFGAGVLAWLVVAKFERHLPVYRHQEMLLGPLKLWLSRTLLCGLLRATAGTLRPLERRIIEHVLQNNVLQVDETHAISKKASWQGGPGISLRLRRRRLASIRLLRLPAEPQPRRAGKDSGELHGLPADRRLHGVYGVGARLAGAIAGCSLFCARPPRPG